MWVRGRSVDHRLAPKLDALLSSAAGPDQLAVLLRNFVDQHQTRVGVWVSDEAHSTGNWLSVEPGGQSSCEAVGLVLESEFLECDGEWAIDSLPRLHPTESEFGWRFDDNSRFPPTSTETDEALLVEQLLNPFNNGLTVGRFWTFQPQSVSAPFIARTITNGVQKKDFFRPLLSSYDLAFETAWLDWGRRSGPATQADVPRTFDALSYDDALNVMGTCSDAAWIEHRYHLPAQRKLLLALPILLRDGYAEDPESVFCKRAIDVLTGARFASMSSAFVERAAPELLHKLSLTGDASKAGRTQALYQLEDAIMSLEIGVTPEVNSVCGLIRKRNELMRQKRGRASWLLATLSPQFRKALDELRYSKISAVSDAADCLYLAATED